MKFKTLLLGSAATLVVAGGAQAADLSIAEPVEFVRICDAFGTGYWYIPGTDTCIKIGGKVQFDLKFRKGGFGDYALYSYGPSTGSYITETGVTSGQIYGSWVYWSSGSYTVSSGHSSDWKFVIEASVDFTAKSMTEYGPLVGYLKLKGVWDGVDGGGGVNVDEAYLSLGHILFGYTGSAANFSDGYAPGPWHGDVTTNQIKLSWAAAGFGIQLGIEDPYKRWNSELPLYPDGYSMPDITGNVTFSGGHWNAKLIGGWSELWDGSVYGVGGTVEATMDMFSVMVGGAYGTGTTYIGGASIFQNYDTNWTAFISGKVAVGPTVSIAASWAYAANDTDNSSATAGGAKLVWAPVPGFEAYAEGKAWKYSGEDQHDWEGKVGVARSF